MDRTRLDAVLRQHLSDGAALAAGVMLSAFHTTHEVMAGRVTEDTRRAAAQMLVDLVAINDNAWWRARGALALGAIGPAITHLQAGAPLLDVLTDIVLAVATADLGFAKAQEISAALRPALQAL